ncbi:MAG: PBSX family phage terminase large subunit [Komagataeibacter hansenii]|nr:PBSX family phage terminase large subunit [Novacetimonas hansenii]
MTVVRIEIPPACADIMRPARYKILYGGRGSGKSWTVARVIVAMAAARPLRILCCREYHSSMADSVRRLLSDQVAALGLGPWFRIRENLLTTACGSEILFRGLGRNVEAIKSTEKVDICWVEEAQSLSRASLDILLPTIRAPGSEIWFTYNPEREDAPMHQMMRALRDDPDAIVRHVGWRDNPWFPPELDAERRRMLRYDPDSYDHVWEGECRTRSDAVVFGGHVEVAEFTTPPDARLYFGVDWGFARDPTVMVRCFIADDIVHVDHEVFATGVEMDDLAALFDHVPGAREWPVRADASRPETISYLATRFGFRMTAAAKWPGSVQDGIARLRAFRCIRVHPRCEHIARELRLYSWRVDRLTGDVLPVLADGWDHGIDALRYALDGVIRNRRRMPAFTPAAIRRI